MQAKQILAFMQHLNLIGNLIALCRMEFTQLFIFAEVEWIKGFFSMIVFIFPGSHDPSDVARIVLKYLSRKFIKCEGHCELFRVQAELLIYIYLLCRFWQGWIPSLNQMLQF